jgi:hypothetical protein
MMVSITRDGAASGLAVKAATRRLRRWPAASVDRLRPTPRSVAVIETGKLPATAKPIASHRRAAVAAPSGMDDDRATLGPTQQPLL